MKTSNRGSKRKSVNLLTLCAILITLGMSVLESFGCAGLSTTVHPIPVSVTISPTSATVTAGGTQQFTATVQNASNTAVTWQVNGVTGGSATMGTISSSGLYTAPATVPSPAAVTVKAVSQADPTKSASAQVTITAVPVVSVTVSPTSATVTAGGTQQFTATVRNTSNTAVTWQVNGVTGGNATMGTISSSGLYSAPASVPSPATIMVTAVSQADPTKSASAQVTITAVPVVSVTISPTSATVATGGTQQFTATVQNAGNTAVTWQVNGVAGGNATVGTISSSGLYTAPAAVPSPATVTVTAVSQADPTKSASAQVAITAVIGIAFYVSTTGSDSNPGTLLAPWRTIQHASNSVLAGDTVFVRGGVYNESVNISVSGSALAGSITFQTFPGEQAIVDGTGLVPSTSNPQGLFNITNQSYISIQGFEIRNYQTSNASATPAGIWVSGSGSNIKLLNNVIHNIVTTSETNGNAFGIAVYGTSAPASLDSVTISGNQVYALRTGNSESVNVDGNVTNFVITNNIVHDNDNIGIDVIGFEGVSPDPAYDFARNGTVSGNTVYNISAINNPGEGNQYDANGIYVDGASQVVIERNLVHNVDIGIEMASEHAGHVTSFVTARNNIVYSSNSVGITIGGYASNVGGTDHCTIVNNTLFQNDTKNTGSGEFQIQYYATNNMFKNNIVYASSSGLFINNYTSSEPDPADVDYNLYYSSLSSSMANFLWNGTNHAGFSSYQTATGKDGHSQYVDPQFLSLTIPNLQIQPTSPAVNAGVNLGSAIVGTLDFAGNPRIKGTTIDIGAYEQ